MKRYLVATALMLAGAVAAAETQGVGKAEITLGTIQDLSGPIAAYGKQARMGMQLRLEEANEQGGVHGRKLKLLVEDSAYDPKRAVLAAQKLVQQDRIFAMVGHLGSTNNLAAMPVQFERNVVNFLPLAPTREMYEPAHRLKVALLVSNFDQMRQAVPKLVADKRAERVCVIHQDDEFGLDMLRGTEAGLAGLRMKPAEVASYKRGATDFSSQVARMKAAQCDLVVLGTVIRETVGVIAESRKAGFAPTFLAGVAAYTDLIHKLGGPAMNGLYATMSWTLPYVDDESQPVRFWANKFKTRFGEDPTTTAVGGYLAMDVFVRAATKAGPNLSTDGFVRAMDSLVVPPDIFGGPELSWSANKRLGSDASRLAQIVDGRWKVVSGYLSAP